jgi:antitoxin VapB
MERLQIVPFGISMSDQRHVRLFRNGRNQAVRIPVEFELPGNEAIMHRDGERLVIEPVRKRGLVALRKTMKPIESGISDIDDPSPKPENVFDPLHAGYKYNLRPDQEPPRQGGQADRQGGRKQHLYEHRSRN